MLCNNITKTYTDKQQPQITLTLTSDIDITPYKAICDDKKLLTIEISKQKKKRSLDSNSYLWIICQKIAEVIHSTKELVYQKTIRDVGQFEIIPIKDEAVERWIEVWNSKGLGWFAEVMEESKLKGYTKVISYYGSSVYSGSEMSVLLNEIVGQAKELKIETMPLAELEALKSSWGKFDK
jgi:hypothetical protein